MINKNEDRVTEAEVVKILRSELQEIIRLATRVQMENTFLPLLHGIEDIERVSSNLQKLTVCFDKLFRAGSISKSTDDIKEFYGEDEA